jgi:hypothetical protein
MATRAKSPLHTALCDLVGIRYPICPAWIVSDGASVLTGQTIVLDGGLTVVSPLARLADDSKPGGGS